MPGIIAGNANFGRVAMFAGLLLVIAAIAPSLAARFDALMLDSALEPLFALPSAWALGALASMLGAVALDLYRRLRQKQRSENVLASRCGEISSRVRAMEAANGQLVLEGIQTDFAEWNLSGAERDVAWFMLRGLPMKQIAGLRGTSERTVRQQAQSIYRKAGLEGRSDLAGRVLERFI